MSQIRIDVNGVQTEHRSFKRAYRKIKDEEQQLSSSRQRIDGRISARRSIDSRMGRAGSRLMGVENQLEALYDFIEHGLQSYIQADDKAKEHPFEKKKKKSIWDKIGDGLQAAAHGVTGFMEGTAEAVIGTVEGLWTMVTHPIETVQGLVYVVKHPLQTAQGIWKAVSDSWTNEVVNGDADSRGRWFGRMIGEVALSVVGTKGVDKVAKLAKGTRIVREGGGVRIVRLDTPERVQGQPDLPKPPKPEGDTLTKGSTKERKPSKWINDVEGAANLGKDELVVADKSFLNSQGRIDWDAHAPNGGYVTGTRVDGARLEEGTLIDRYGNERGSYTSPLGTGYGERALPYVENSNAYHQYKVVKPIDDVSMGEIAPAFKQSGGGIQYELPNSIEYLKSKGYLEDYIK
ncbi:TNT domain-containing protein [Cohnella sp. GCM10027633]|uniref:TNT domain-containing protein n=1 Tax=unclassified Cohnella TaxID=2636738 RepID=UPI00362A13DB